MRTVARGDVSPSLQPATLARHVAQQAVQAADGQQTSAVLSLLGSDDATQTTQERIDSLRALLAGASQDDLDALREARAMRPDAFGVNRRLGQLCTELNMHVEALECFEAASAARPDDTDMLFATITLQTRLGQYERSLALLPRLAAIPGMRGDALYQEALIHDVRGDRELALARVAEGRELPAEESYRLLSMHGRFLIEDGDYQGARDRFAAALAGRPDYKEALQGLSAVCRRQGLAEEADHWDEVLAQFLELTDNEHTRREKSARRKALARLVEIYPEWRDAFQQLAVLQQQVKDRDGACATIERYLELYGGEVDAEEQERLRRRFCGARS